MTFKLLLIACLALSWIPLSFSSIDTMDLLWEFIIDGSAVFIAYYYDSQFKWLDVLASKT